jgi:hypothetical protein
MSQNDMTIANQGFPATRADINSALQALASTSSGATEPSTMFANQLWFDTTANKLKIRNEANSAWYDIVGINESTGALTINSATIGATTAAAGTFTTVTTSGNATIGGTAAMSSSFLRNRIINGDMRIDQRNAGASVTPTNTYTLDRWQGVNTQASKFTVQQNAGSVTPPVGFTNYLGVTSSSAYSVLTGDTFYVVQYIEGFNIADFAWGSANATAVTFSFWARSSLTGTFGGSLANSAGNRAYPFSYTISSANTWEQKTVTIAGDTTGTWLTNNGTGIQLRFGLGSGVTYSGTANAWGAANAVQPTGSVSVVGTSGATFYITGVQLEVGAVATPFERQLYNAQLAQCQRYYWQSSGGQFVRFALIYADSTTSGQFIVSTPVPLRAAPTFTSANLTVNGVAITSVVMAAYSNGLASLQGNVASGLSAGTVYQLYTASGQTGTIALSAEL